MSDFAFPPGTKSLIINKVHLSPSKSSELVIGQTDLVNIDSFFILYREQRMEA